MLTAVISRIPNVSIRVIVLVMCFEIVVSGLLVWLGVVTLGTANKADQLAAQVARNAETQYQACLETNMSRARQVTLWTALFATAAPHPTAAEQATISQYLVIVRTTFPPETCHNPS